MPKAITCWLTEDGEIFRNEQDAIRHEKIHCRSKYISAWVKARLDGRGYTPGDLNLIAEVLNAYAELEGRKPNEMPRSLDDILDRLAQGKPAFPERLP